MEEQEEQVNLDTAEDVDAYIDEQGLAPAFTALAHVYIDKFIELAEADPAVVVGMMAGFSEGMYEAYDHPRCIGAGAKRRFFDNGRAAARQVLDSGMLHAEAEMMGGGSRVTKGQA